ncbi:hypothetical protein KH5H1_32700 [Corallococcus caeni]|nr:hypothetical protein KH5H1_32700 [Corallococcus sp. KH5-1]
MGARMRNQVFRPLLLAKETSPIAHQTHVSGAAHKVGTEQGIGNVT